MKSSAFTILELMIAIAIVSIIAAIAVPSYLDYSKRAKWSELVKATAPYKIAVAECLAESNGDASNCNAGQHGIPADRTGGIANTNIESIQTAAGVITITAKADLGSDTLILTAMDNNGIISWIKTGSAIDKGLVK